MNRLIRIFLLSALCLFFGQMEAQTFLISQGGTVNTCTGTIYDSGGAAGNYQNNENYTMTFCSDDPTGCLQLSFSQFAVENGFDNLNIYAGPTATGTPYATFTGTALPGIIYTGTECVTLVFTSDVSVTPAGFAIDITCVCPSCDDGILNGFETGVDCGGPDCEECDFIIISQGGTATTCTSIIYDSGLFGNYSNSEFHVLTVCADDTATCLGLDFLSFDVENFFDSLIVYDGLSITDPIIGAYSGLLDPFILSAPGTCVTLKFISDASVVRPGFEIGVTCVCATCEDGILNGQEIDTDCGGPDCPECLFNVITEGGTVTSCDAVLFDSGINGNYGANENYSMTFCGDGTGDCLLLDFLNVNIANGDHLFIYDGEGTSGFLIADVTATTNQADIVAPGTCVTFNFTSDGFTQNAGFEIGITCAGVCPACTDGILNGYEIGVDCGGPDCEECDFIVMNGTQTENSCGTTIYDNGLFGNYANNSNDVLTICGENLEDCVQLEFLQFNIENGWDFMTIFDGPDTSYPIIGTYTGTVIPQFISNGSNCLTIQFTSDGIIDSPGYEIAVSCVCPTCDDGILNGYEIGVDCGGPDCEECDFILISNEETITACEGTVFDSGLNGPYQVNEDYTMTICADDPSSCIMLDFASFNIENGFDNFTIYEGTNANGAPIQNFTGNLGAFTYTAPYSCITINFFSDFIITAAGFEFNISCVECQIPTEQDCLGANYVCSNVFVQESYPPAPGNFPIQLPPGVCLDNALNVIWYTFTVQEAGNLSFILTPESGTDDYDWALFDLTNASCDDISSSPELVVSCNSYGQFGTNGPTGISTSNGGVGNLNGPGDLNGPPFNADYPVLVGQTFALLVQNWTGSFDGYTLDFSETTAGIFTNEDEGLLLESAFPLGLVETSTVCDTALARLTRQCSADTAYYVLNYLVSDSSATYGVDYEPLPTSIIMLPQQGDTMFSIVTIPDNISEEPEYICVEISASDSEFGTYIVIDTVCVMILDSYTFSVDADLEYIYCPEDSTELWAVPGLPGLGPYTYTWLLNGEEVFDDVPFIVPIPEIYGDSVVYDLIVQDYCGAFNDPTQSLVANFIPPYPQVTIESEGQYCPGLGIVLSTVNEGGTSAFTYLWVDEYGVTYEDAAEIVVDPQLSYPADENGAVTFFVTLSDACSPSRVATDSVEVVFREPLEVSLQMNDFICTDQELDLNTEGIGGYPPYSYSWSVKDLMGNTLPLVIEPFPFDGEGVAYGFVEDEMNNPSGMYVIEVQMDDWCSLEDGSFVSVALDADTVEAQGCFVPNVVSPNGDGMNDSFIVYRLINTPGTMSIFNRWGKLLKQTNLSEWQPTDEAEGTYFFTIQYTNGESEKGSFTIVR